MSPKDFRRARSADAIEARRTDLLSAARRLLDAQDPTDVSLAAICSQAGLVKSAVYRYFESREDVLTEVLLQDLTRFEADFAAALKAVAQDDLLEIARVYAELIVARPRMAALISQLSTILERNISSARLLEVKLQMRDRLGGCIGVMAEAAPSLGPKKAQAAVQMLYMQVSAYYSSANPNEKIAALLEREDLAVFKVDYQTELERACRAVLLGVSSEAF